MASGYVTLLDRFVPPLAARDDRRRARLTAGVLLSTAAIAPLLAAPFARSGATAVVAAALVCSLAAAVTLLTLRAGRLLPCAHASVGIVYLLLCGFSAVSGGLQAPALPWLAILPMLALGLAGRNAAVIWTMFVVAAVSALYVAHASAVDLPVAVGPQSLPAVQFSAVLGLSLLVLATATLFEATRAQAERETEASHRQLAGARDVLQKALIATRAAATAKNQFLANVSHEIRTPLNGVVGMTGLLLETPLTEEQRDYAESVRQCGESLLSVVDGILDYADLEAGDVALDARELRVRALVTEVLEAFDATARARGLGLSCRVDADVPDVLRGDPDRLRQVLAILVANAVKFTERGEVLLGVALEKARGPDPVLRFEVEDSGIGLTPEQQQRLFRPFAQADDSSARKYGGTGLGLAIAHELVTLMGGRLGVRSEYGRGSSFWFTARLERRSAPTTERAEELARLRVLVIDPDALSRRIARAHLDAAGLCVGEAVDALDGLDRLRAAFHEGSPYDLVVVELQMPHMDGIELAAEVRADPALARLPIVALASTGDAESRERARRAGIGRYLTKPSGGPPLLEAVTALLLPGAADAVPAPPLAVASAQEQRPPARDPASARDDMPGAPPARAVLPARADLAAGRAPGRA